MQWPSCSEATASCVPFGRQATFTLPHSSVVGSSCMMRFTSMRAFPRTVIASSFFARSVVMKLPLVRL